MSVPCALCSAEGSRVLYALPNGDIRRCVSCGVAFRENLVSGDAATEMYEDDSYLDQPYFERLKVGSSRDVEPWLVYERVLRRLESLTRNRSLLDVGASYGAFLELARERGWQVSGVELSTKAAAYAATARQLELHVGTLEQSALPLNHYGAVTMWDVVEHLDDPLRTLREVHRVLAPGGVLVIFTINQKSLINRVGHALHQISLGAARRPLVLLYDIHHNFFFDRKTLSGVLRRAGFGDPVAEDHLSANIDRWQNVPIPPLLALGTRALDVAAKVVGGPYRMILYVQK
jgi:SAM-dependent methyltransferase